MLEFETMEEERLMTSHSRHQKVLALAIATVFVGAGNNRNRGNVLVTEKLSFNSSYQQYAEAIKSNTASADEVLELAKQTYYLGKKKFGAQHRSTYMLQQNLAHAYMDLGEFRLAAIHYKSVLQYNEDVFGDDSQDYFFTLLDIINLLKSATLSSEKRLSEIPRSFISLSDALNKLLGVTEHLIVSMPESALLFQEQTLKASYSNPGLVPASKVKELAHKQVKDTIGTYGRLSEAAIEARFFLGKIYLDIKARKKAIAEFEAVLEALDEILEFSHPYALASHVRLVTLYELQGNSVMATKHCKAIGQIYVWSDNDQQKPLYQVAPKLNKLKVKRSTNSKCEGRVVVRFDISKLGYVKNAEVTQSSNDKVNADILYSFQQWRFAPKYLNGVAIEAKQQYYSIEYAY